MTRAEYEYSQLPKYEELEYTRIRCARLKDWNKCYYADNQQIPKSLVHSVEKLEHGHELMVKKWFVDKNNINSGMYETYLERRLEKRDPQRRR